MNIEKKANGNLGISLIDKLISILKAKSTTTTPPPRYYTIFAKRQVYGCKGKKCYYFQSNLFKIYFYIQDADIRQFP